MPWRGHANDLQEPQVKEGLDVGRFEDDCRVGTTTGPGDGDHWLVGADHAGVRGHQGHLGDDLHALAEGAEGVGDDLLQFVRAQLLAHRPPYTPKGVLACKDLGPGGLDGNPVLVS